jgi:hypothetical protein
MGLLVANDSLDGSTRWLRGLARCKQIAKRQIPTVQEQFMLPDCRWFARIHFGEIAVRKSNNLVAFAGIAHS